MKEFARGSLFDRLIDLDPYVQETSTTLKTLTRKELVESVKREISWLLNTTCSFSQEDLEGRERNCLNYGVYDFSCFFPDSSDNRTRLAKIVEDAIEAYEPRLKNTEVTVNEMSSKNDKFTLSLLIDGELLINKISEPVSFIMAIE